MKEIKIGLQHSSKFLVTTGSTAVKIGSGSLPVLATPEMISLMENAAMMAVENCLEEGDTTVGAGISVSHLRPSAIGATIIATAELTQVDGRKLTFHVVAKDEDDVIGEGEHIRFIVNADNFMKKVRS